MCAPRGLLVIRGNLSTAAIAMIISIFDWRVVWYHPAVVVVVGVTAVVQSLLFLFRTELALVTIQGPVVVVI
jgi:hypothetical protein